MIDFAGCEAYNKESVLEINMQWEESMKVSEDKSNLMPKLILMIGVFCCSLSSAFVKMMTAPSSVAATYRLGMAVLLLTPYVFLNNL